MRVMTHQQSARLDKLLVLARGNMDLVERSFRFCQRPNGRGALLTDVIRYIERYRGPWLTRDGNALVNAPVKEDNMDEALRREFAAARDALHRAEIACADSRRRLQHASRVAICAFAAVVLALAAHAALLVFSLG